MEVWAQQQKIDRVEVVTDEGGEEVSVHRLKQAIKKLTQDGTVSQLLIYFAGHGINIGFSEYWLLSDAIGDPDEAVNVKGSEALARYGRVPHVLFFSDACRTAAEGVHAQAVSGSEIFRNEPGDGRSRWVDLFYATLLGKPAHEIKDSAVSAARYEALYTESLIEILSGDEPQALEPEDESTTVVRPWGLKAHVEERMLDRLAAKGLDLEIVQPPDAVITSQPVAWVARFAGATRRRSTRGGPGPAAPASTRGGRRATAPRIDTLRRASSAGLEQLLSGVPSHRSRGRGGRPEALESTRLSAVVERDSRSFGPTHFETGCGFKLRGARLAHALAVRSTVETLGDMLVRVSPPRAGGDDLLLTLSDGRGVLLPVLPGFLGALTFEGGELAHVVYEPSEGPAPENLERWEQFRHRREELALLRALIAESARHGVFRLEGERAFELAERIRVAKGIDPTMALYAAYAYHELHRAEVLAEMAQLLEEDLGFQLFDVALLDGRLRDRRRQRAHPVLPLLTQGWALLNAYGARLPQKLEPLRGHLLPSLWTLYAPAGAQLLENTIRQRKAGR